MKIFLTWNIVFSVSNSSKVFTSCNMVLKLLSTWSIHRTISSNLR